VTENSPPQKASPYCLGTLRRLLPHVWHYRWRVLGALILLVIAKTREYRRAAGDEQLVDRLDLKMGVLIIQRCC